MIEYAMGRKWEVQEHKIGQVVGLISAWGEVVEVTQQPRDVNGEMVLDLRYEIAYPQGTTVFAWSDALVRAPKPTEVAE